MTQPFKSAYIILEPQAPASVPANALFIDSTNANALSFKNASSITQPVEPQTGTNLFTKQMQAGEAFPVNTPLSKRSDGKVVGGDSDGPNGQKIIAYALEASAGDGSLVNVLCLGANLVNAITGLGFAPGDNVFMGENGEYINDINNLTGGNDSIIRVGIADCSSGTASATANDLIVATEVVSRP